MSTSKPNFESEMLALLSQAEFRASLGDFDQPEAAFLEVALAQYLAAAKPYARSLAMGYADDADAMLNIEQATTRVLLALMLMRGVAGWRTSLPGTALESLPAPAVYHPHSWALGAYTAVSTTACAQALAAMARRAPMPAQLALPPTVRDAANEANAAMGERSTSAPAQSFVATGLDKRDWNAVPAQPFLVKLDVQLPHLSGGGVALSSHWSLPERWFPGWDVPCPEDYQHPRVGADLEVLLSAARTLEALGR